MPINPVILTTDALLWLLVATIVGFLVWAKRQEPLQIAWQRIAARHLAVISMMIMLVFISIAVLDSVHFQRRLPAAEATNTTHFSPKVESVLDVLMGQRATHEEKTYSAPFATQAFVKETTVHDDGSVVRDYPALKYAGRDLNSPDQERGDIVWRLVQALLISSALFLMFVLIVASALRRNSNYTRQQALRALIKPQGYFPWPTLLATVFTIIFTIAALSLLSAEYHIFGTNKVGIDVFYQTVKSIRTGIMIGTLTTLIMLPFAVSLGIMAGYFGGRIDDAIQYLYTTLSSIPGVLLIAASILSLQIFISNHPEWFSNLASRADARLLALCAILGVTSWTSLCRLLRAETLKTRDLDYIRAAKALGTGNFRIIFRHILPNVFHIVLIAWFDKTPELKR